MGRSTERPGGAFKPFLWYLCAMLRTTPFALALLVAGCPSSPGIPDAPSLDAPTVDVPATLDVPAAPDAPDAPRLDAPASDAPAPGDAGMCAADANGIGTDCTMDADCPAGYVCQGFSGIIFTQSCQIRCDLTACPCPGATTCQTVGDKGGTWMQCVEDV